MKSVSLANEVSDYKRIFAEIKNRQSDIVVWQLDEGKRYILNSKLTNFNLESGLLYFELNENGEISSGLPLYGYCEDGQIIFKCRVQDVQIPHFSSSIPEEIRLLEEVDVSSVGKNLGINSVWKGHRFGGNYDYIPPDILKVKSMSERSARDQQFLQQEFMSVDEEDKLYSNLRESPRARPKNEKYVKIKVKEINEPIPFQLFDLSRGGLSFIVDSQFLFERGNIIQIMGFDDYSLDDPFLGEVMGVRPIDGDAQAFKVGIKFKDGQN